MNFNKVKEEYKKAQYYVSIGQGYSDAEARAIAYEEDEEGVPIGIESDVRNIDDETDVR